MSNSSSVSRGSCDLGREGRQTDRIWGDSRTLALRVHFSASAGQRLAGLRRRSGSRSRSLGRSARRAAGRAQVARTAPDLVLHSIAVYSVQIGSSARRRRGGNVKSESNWHTLTKPSATRVELATIASILALACHMLGSSEGASEPREGSEAASPRLAMGAPSGFLASGRRRQSRAGEVRNM